MGNTNKIRFQKFTCCGSIKHHQSHCISSVQRIKFLFLISYFQIMITIPNTNNDPARNLAMEEYILTGMGMREPVLFFYVYAPSIIVGSH